MPAPTTRPRAAPPAARRTALGALLGTALLAGGGAHAQPPVSDKPVSNTLSNVKPWQRPATLGEIAPGVTPGLQARGGILFSPILAGKDENFGHLFTDEPNRPLLNQLLFIAGRDAGSRTAGYDYGFKLALLYGSDARIVHTLGVFGRLTEDRRQLAMLEANVTARRHHRRALPPSGPRRHQAVHRLPLVAPANQTGLISRTPYEVLWAPSREPRTVLARPRRWLQPFTARMGHSVRSRAGCPSTRSTRCWRSG